MAQLSFSDAGGDLPPWAQVEEPYGLFGQFLMSDVQENSSSARELLATIDAVERGEHPPFRSEGNGFELTVDASQVTVRTLFATKEETSCMPLMEFRDLLWAWDEHSWRLDPPNRRKP